MVLRSHVAIFVALAHVNQVRRVGHAFHATHDDDIGVAGGDSVTAHNGGLQTRSAHLVDGDRFKALVHTSLDSGLARWRLALPSRQAVAHDKLIGFVGTKFRLCDSRLDGDGPKLVGRQRGQIAQEPTHRGARHTDNHHRIRSRHQDTLLVSLLCTCEHLALLRLYRQVAFAHLYANSA